MWMLIPLIMLLMCLSGYTVHIQQQAANAQADAEAAITGDRMRIYLNAVQHYARVHPDFRSDVPERIYGAYSATGRQCTGRRRSGDYGRPDAHLSERGAALRSRAPGLQWHG